MNLIIDNRLFITDRMFYPMIILITGIDYRNPEPYRNPIDAGIHKRKRPDDREREFSGYEEKSHCPRG